MRNKSLIVVTALLIFSVVLSACGTALAQSPSPTPATEPSKRTISVNGTSQAYLTPDIGYIYIGVHTEDKDVNKAVNSNNERSQTVVKALKDSGITEKDIRTINFNIYPQQQMTPQNVVTGTLYIVDNTVFVTLRDITKVGDVITKAIDAGANNINGIQFDVADKEAALADARKAAVANARARADELAKAAGVTVGAVQSISFYGGGYNAPTPMYDAKGGAMQQGVSVSVNPGQLTYTVDVSIVYEIQ
jgi:uncharacterized protein